MNFIPPQDEGRLRAAASGVLPNGVPVAIKSDGTVSQIGGDTLGTTVTYESGDAQYNSMTYDTSNDKVVIAYRDVDNSNYGTAVIGTVSDTSISFGTPVVFESASVRYVDITFDSNSNKVVISYEDAGNSSHGTAIVGTVSGTSISFGSAAVFNSGTTYYTGIAYDSNADRTVIGYRDQGDSNQGKAIVGTISGTDISFGTEVEFEAGSSEYIKPVFDSSNNKIVISFDDGQDGTKGKAVVGTVSGTSISFGSTVTWSSGFTAYHSTVFDSNSNKVVIAYRDDSDSNKGKAIVGTVSGTSISFGTAAEWSSTRADYISTTFDTTANKVIINFNAQGDSNKGKYVVGTVSGTSISFGSTATYASSVVADHQAVTYDPDEDRIVLAYRDDTASPEVGRSLVLKLGTAEALTSENYIGISSGDVEYTGSTSEKGTPVVFEAAAIDFAGSAFDTNSNKVVIAYRDEGNSEHGTAIVGTVDSSDNSISFGSAVVFESAATGFLHADGVVFDSNSNKIVIAYSDEGNSSYGTAIIGTVSGTSISFGTPVVFESASTDTISAVFDSNLNKIVIAYSDEGNSEYGTAIVGTVSGTSISFGSPTVFNASDTKNISTCFDSSNNKIVVAYADAGNSDKNTAIVGTVSGTSISFGSEVIFDASTGSKIGQGLTAAFDTNVNKVLIAYTDVANSYYGTAIVGTVSGTSISFGSAAVFNPFTTELMDSVFDSNDNQVVIAYKDEGGSNRYGAANSCIISGTSVTFSDKVVFGTGWSQNPTATFDSNSNRVVSAYRDQGNSNHGTAVVFKTDTRTATRGQVASGSSASVDIIGTVNEQQTGLTAGQQYFVQTDGTIGLTADDPSVFAGTAISSTSLLVKA